MLIFIICCSTLNVKFLALERKISVRANRDELIERGILLPESTLSPIPEPGKLKFFTQYQ